MAITNPPRCGELVDYANLDKFLLVTNLTTVDFSTTSRYQMNELKVTYDGKELTFLENIPADQDEPTFPNNSWVTLDMNLGSGLQNYFTGRIRRRTRTEPQHTCEYQAFGIHQLCNEIAAQQPNGMPLIQFNRGMDAVTFSTTTSSGYVAVERFGKGIAAALLTLTIDTLPYLLVSGYPIAVGVPGYESLNGNINSDMTIQNTGFIDAANQILQCAPKYRIFYDDTQEAWTFPDILNADVVTIDIRSVNMYPGLNYTEDLSKRFTAIRMIAHEEGEGTVTGQQSLPLTPDWGESPDDWSVADAVDGSMVYRKFKMEVPEGGGQDSSGRLACYVVAEFNYWKRPVRHAVGAWVDWGNKTVVTYEPLVICGNAHHPGDAKPATAANLICYESHSAPYEGWPTFRYPTTGFIGSAYTLYDIQNEKVELVDINELNLANAVGRLDLLKDVVIDGDIQIEGDPIPELINLNKRICVVHPDHVTGLETANAIFLGYTYKFGKRGVSTISMTTNLEGMIRVN